MTIPEPMPDLSKTSKPRAQELFFAGAWGWALAWLMADVDCYHKCRIPSSGSLASTDYWDTLAGVLQDTSTYGPTNATLQLTTELLSLLPGHVASVSPLREIEKLIESSRTILELGENWDDNGAFPVAQATWDRAVEFLRNSASTLWLTQKYRMSTPSIGPLADGSIDLHWKLPDRELLINIPPVRDTWATYYGDNRQGGNVVKGSFKPEAANAWLFVWLTE